MGGARKRIGQAKKSVGGGDAEAETGRPRYLEAARKLQQMTAAVEGDRDQRDAFAASPDQFRARYGVDTDAMRPADPSGKAAGAGGLVIGPSALSGEGLHTAASLATGSKVCDVELDGKQSVPVSKMNRASTPNAQIVMRGGRMEAVLVAAVEPGDEIVLDYPADSDLPPDVVAHRGDNYPTS